MLHGYRKSAGETSRNFLQLFSSFGKIIFIITYIISFSISITNFQIFILYDIIIALALSFIVTFLFEFIYNLFRNKSNL